jgi:predicted chitinase
VEIAPGADTQSTSDRNTVSLKQPTLTKALLENRFYELPLGWLMSNQTRSIIEDQSGRFSECTPDRNFIQAQEVLSPADCVQLLIYHELNQSLPAFADQAAVYDGLIAQDKNTIKSLNIEEIIACYRERVSQSDGQQRIFNLEQTGNMRALMTLWRREYSDADPAMAYLMATAAVESYDFRSRRQSLDYSSAQAILGSFGSHFKNVPLEEIERYVHNPQGLAEEVYGGKWENGVGNGDGWRYRGRGLAFLTFKKNYREQGIAIGVPNLVYDPELIFIPTINARVFINVYFPPTNIPKVKEMLADRKWLDLRAMVLAASGQGLQSLERTAQQIDAPEQMFAACVKNPSVH